MRIVFHGNTAKAFGERFADLLDFSASVHCVSEALADASERSSFENADAIVTPRLDRNMPVPRCVQLFQCLGAGFDGIDQRRRRFIGENVTRLRSKAPLRSVVKVIGTAASP